MNARNFSLFLMITWLAHCKGAEEYRPAKPIKNAENALDVTYLPHRLTGDWRDRWLKMNVHWPKGLKADERRPCILFVHGGGYSGGDKDGGFCKQAKERAIDQGFVVANMNYILGRDMFPQVFYDFRAAVRFLRANAAKYHIDPDRIGAWGFSAGGWLISSSSFTDAGDLYTAKRQAISEAWPMDDPRREKMLRRFKQTNKKDNLSFLAPMDDPTPNYGEYSSRIQALQADFNQFENNITSSAPAICTYIGKGGESKLRVPAKAAGVDFFELVLEHPKKKFDGLRAVHVPPLEMKVPTPDGKGEMELQDRVIQWFKLKLIDEPTTPVPEFRPQQRVFNKNVTVHVIKTSPGTRIHYTIDGSAPTLNSPVWDGPIHCSKSTLISALAVKDGFKPSGVAVARFIPGDVPPKITGPMETVLKGQVGQPLKIQFSSESEKPIHWHLTAHYRPETGHRFKGGLKEFGGLTFDPKTATLKGTPTKPFVYTLQIQAGWNKYDRASVRTYVLRVK